MGTFLDPLGGVIAAQDVIVHNQGVADAPGGATKVVITDPSTGSPVASGAGQVFESHTMLHIAASLATTVVKSGAGVLKRISVNTKGASANVITAYDNTAGSGTIIAVIDGTSDRDHTYDGAFGTGLTLVSATGTGADLTVVFD